MLSRLVEWDDAKLNKFNKVEIGQERLGWTDRENRTNFHWL